MCYLDLDDEYGSSMRLPRLREEIVCDGEFDVFRIIVPMPPVISDRGVIVGTVINCGFLLPYSRG